ncbi:hypothetical protein V866_006630 [Kwoniella sp. B9012]
MYPDYHGSSWSTQPPAQGPTNRHSSHRTSQLSHTGFGTSSYSFSPEEENPPPLPPRPKPTYLGVGSSQGGQQSPIPLQTLSSSNVGGSFNYDTKSVYDPEGKPLRIDQNDGEYTPPSMMSYQRPVHSGKSSTSIHSLTTAGILGGMTGGIALSGDESAGGGDAGDGEGDGGEGNPLRNLNLDPGVNPGPTTSHNPGDGDGDGGGDTLKVSCVNAFLNVDAKSDLK